MRRYIVMGYINVCILLFKAKQGEYGDRYGKIGIDNGCPPSELNAHQLCLLSSGHIDTATY